jgi:hypothetical protein
MLSHKKHFAHYFLPLAALLLASVSASGQAKVSGRVQNTDKQPIAHASVLLLRSTDSALVKGVTSNTDGQFVLEKIAQGNYLLLASYAGMQDQYSPAFSLQAAQLDLGVIQLTAVPAQLKSVTVTGKKPLFEQKPDRMVINVKSSISNAGSTVLDVLEKSPGVSVNRSSGEIGLKGKQGVQVMINGKMTYMPADALVQMLNGLNASNVERIELITTPPAKYDAAGNAGFINIVMVASPDQGFNGSYTLSPGYGQGEMLGANANFNYRKKQLNFYGNYSYSRDGQAQEFTNYRRVQNEGKIHENDVVSVRDPYQQNNNLSLGLDYNIGKKTVMGVLVGGYNNKWSMGAVNYSNSYVDGMLDTSIIINNNEVNHWRNLMGNFNIQHHFKEGEQLSFNTDYTYYKNNNPTGYENNYYDKNDVYLFTTNTSSDKETIIKLFASNIDYTKKLGTNTNLEMGVKAALSTFTNDVLVQEKINGGWVPDPKYTANYFLDENIYAAYISADTKLGEKTTLKAGLRYEYTTSNLGSETQKDIVDRKYGRLFPTFYISQKIDDNNSLNFSYNRRINRPSFTQLAPFLIFFDPKTFITGNPALQPSIADAVNIDYLFRKLIFSVSYTYVDQPIARFLNEVDSSNNSQVTTSSNLEYSKQAFASVTWPVKVTSWWNSQVSVSVNWQKVKGLVNKEMQELSQVYYYISGSESFTLPWNMSVEVSGWWNSKALFGASVVEPLGTLNVAVQKKFPRIAASLTAGVDNLLNSFVYTAEQDIPSQNIYSTGTFLFTQRYYKLTWSQSFGNKVLKDKRSRRTASDEERRRVQ